MDHRYFGAYPRESVWSAKRDWDDRELVEATMEAYSFLEQFSLEVMPALWPKDSTRLQAQIFNVAFAGQMVGVFYTVTDLAVLLEAPRSTINSATEKLIDIGRIELRNDPDDGRRKLLAIPMSMRPNVGDIEDLLLHLLLFWHQKLDRVLKPSEDEQKQEKRRQIISEALNKLEEVE